MITKSISLAAIGALAFSAAAMGAAHAETMKVSASLSSSAEVTAPKSEGSGTLTGTYDPSTMMLKFKVDYKGLSGPATMAHFHAAAPTGKNAPVEIPIKRSVTSPIEGDMKITPADAKNLTDGMTYFNIHTAANPGGEIRGQIMTMK